MMSFVMSLVRSHVNTDLRHNGLIERQAIASNSTPKYYHLVRSNNVLYTDRFTIIFLCDRPTPLSELKQKTDPSCLPNLKLLSFAISDSSSGLTHLADQSCLLIGDSTDHLNEPLRAYRFRITAKLSGKRSPHNSTPKHYNLVRSNDVMGRQAQERQRRRPSNE
jgi:hypothetical protein